MPSVHHLSLLLAMCLSMTVALESSKADGYETFPSVPDSRYKLYSIHLTWQEAVSLCLENGDGSHLVVINSVEEAEVVGVMFSRIADPVVYGVYVGINDIITEGTWVTIQGGLVTTSGYNIWEDGEPDEGTGGNCGCVNRAPRPQYFDNPCAGELPFICEKPNV